MIRRILSAMGITGDTRSINKKIKTLHENAEGGNAEAQLELGKAYLGGDYVEKNETDAYKWYLKAAEQGNAEAQVRLGNAYYYKCFDKRKPSTLQLDAAEERSTGIGNKGGQNKQASFFFSDPKENKKAAIKWYLKAAMQGNEEAQSRLLDIGRNNEKSSPQTNQAAHKKAEIVCFEQGYGSYQVLITAKDIDVFRDAGKNPDIAGKQGEEFVSAILAAGGILRIERHGNGLLNDGANGEPAIQSFNDRGRITSIMHYKNGLLNDTVKGDAGFQAFNEDGVVVRITHYKNGKINDAGNGEAAFILSDEFGKLIWVVHYQEDKLIKALNDQEVSEYQRRKVDTNDIESAIPGLKLR